MDRLSAWIFDAVRTPRGSARPGGALHETRPIDLLGPCYGALVERTGVDTACVDDVVLGCVTAIGEQGANLAKISALYHGWSERVSGVTLNRFCTSGLDAVHYAAAKVSCGAEDLVAAGGVESISRVPMLSDGGAWFGDPEVARATGFVHMGLAADIVASLHGIERKELDAYALQSQRRAAAARDQRRFSASLVSLPAKDGGILLDTDECIRDATTLEKLASLPPLFAEEAARGATDLARARYPALASVEARHTVGTSPALANAASLLLIGGRGAAESLGRRPRARILSFANVSTEPVSMLTGNPLACRKALARAGMEVGDVDLFEINESFAAVPLHFQREMGIDPERLNPLGGAIALGHPLGATGGILLATLLGELERRDMEVGVAAICAGAGIAAATVLERVG